MSGKNMTHTITAAAYHGDIVSRLRNWRGLHLAHSGRLFEEAADAIERLRQSDRLQPVKIEVEQLRRAIRKLADQDATLSVCDGAVAVTMDATLTDAEREAVEAAAWACGNCNGFGGNPTMPAVHNGNKIADALRNLLERLT